MIQELARLARRVAELERRLAGALRPGKVAEVDPAGGTVRLDLGGGMLSPAIPYVQTAGALKLHSPPSVGQLMMMSSFAADTEQGIAIPLSFGGDNASPSSAGDEHVMTFGAVTVLVQGGLVRITVGGSQIEMTGGSIALTSPRIDLN